MAQIYAGFFTEGTTDVRFLESIILNTLKNIAFDECRGQIDIELCYLNVSKTGKTFVEQIEAASKLGMDEFAMMILCVQADADSNTLENTYANKINGAIEYLDTLDDNQYCKNMIALVPIQETESWMLADKELLKREICTDKSDAELGINRSPELIARPKEVIENAIRIARADMVRRRRKELTISDLYQPIGQSLNVDKLEVLSSYQDFKNNVRSAYKKLSLMY